MGDNLREPFEAFRNSIEHATGMKLVSFGFTEHLGVPMVEVLMLGHRGCERLMFEYVGRE